MYVDVAKINQGKKPYIRYLLRKSFREDGKVKHQTIASLNKCSTEEVEAIRLALRYKGDLKQLASIKEVISTEQGLSIGAVWALYSLAKEIGIVDALGTKQEGKLALWQVLARVIDQGSRLSAVRLAVSHAACDVLNLKAFNEDDLYSNLDWLCENQVLIENRLFKKSYPQENSKPSLFLYDVTSSYLEGEQNELAAFGYNRDGKRGKRQIVIGLLCDDEGRALSIEVFRGNMTDPKTVSSQIKKVADRFGGGEVVFVGDRGMIKSQQIKDLQGEGFHYITAITKPQIEKMLEKQVLQMDLFDHELSEIEDMNGIRYILRQNPQRAEEIQKSRKDKYASLVKKIERQNLYLQEHPLAKIDVALRKIKEKSAQLKIANWMNIQQQGRTIEISQDHEALSETKKLDGCYVLKTDLKKEKVSKEFVHARYKDLALVEKSFRSIKTVELEMRPIYVRLEARTRGHAFVVMLAYRIIQELSRRWINFDITVQEGIQKLTTLSMTIVHIQGTTSINQIPKPNDSVRDLLEAVRVTLPDAFPCKGVIVATRKKLPDRRKRK